MNKKLSTFEASCIVAGNGIGGGLMALPFLAQNVGWPNIIIILAIAWLVTVILHMMVADMLLVAKNANGLLSLFNEFLFIGKLKKLLTACFFLLLLITMLFNLSAYVSGGADIITGLLGLPVDLSKLIFYGTAIIVPLSGLKVLGLSEKTTVIMMVLATLTLAIISFIKGSNELEVSLKHWSNIIALYGLAMFAFSSLFSVPQAVEGLEHDPKSVKKAIIFGIGINLLVSLIICFSALYASKTVTEVAIVGWGESLGLPIKLIGSLLILFAMLTPFWTTALALSDMVCQQFALYEKKWLIFICSTIPCLLISLFSGASFTSFIGIAGGAVAVMIALLLLPAYSQSRKTKSENIPLPLLGNINNSKWFIILIGICYGLMAAGAVIAAF